MDDLLRRKLFGIIVEHGWSVCDNPQRCERLLRDSCAEYEDEITVLVMAIEERIPHDLLFQTDLPREVLLAVLGRRLQDRTAFPPTAAEWAVTVWAFTLEELRTQLLRDLREALRKLNDRAIANIYLKHAEVLESLSDFSSDERSLTRTALQRLVAPKVDVIHHGIIEQNDEKIAEGYIGNERLLQYAQVLSVNELERVDLACRRLWALGELRLALVGAHATEIIRLYEEHEGLLKPCRNFNRQERRRVLEVRRAHIADELRRVIRRKKGKEYHQRVVRMAEQATAVGYYLSVEEREAVQRAHHALDSRSRRRQAIAHLQQAIDANDDLRILNAYIPTLLDSHPAVTQQQKDRVRLAQERLGRWDPLRRALARGDDLEIVRLYDGTLFAGSQLLSSQDYERCRLALSRHEAFQRLQKALEKADEMDPEQLLDAHDEALLGPSSLLTKSHKQLIKETRRRAVFLTDLTQALDSRERIRIATVYQAAKSARVRLPDSLDWKAIFDALKLKAALDEFRQALRSSIQNDDQIVRLGQPLLDTAPDLLTPDEQLAITIALQHVGAALRARQR